MTLLLLLAAVAGDSTASLAADTSTVRLSGVVRLTLAVEGQSPLRVEPPAELLDPESAAAWKLTVDGPPSVEGGRWVQRYVADPFAPGEAVRLGLNPVSVWANGAREPQRLTPTALTVRVTTGVADVSMASARPPTGVESLAAPPPAPTNSYLTPAAVVGGGVLVALLLAPLFGRKRRRQSPSADPFAGLNGLADAAFAHRLSDSVRARLHTEAVPARRLTTRELPPGPQRELLARLDGVRFGCGPLTPAEQAELLAAARQVTSAPRQVGPPAVSQPQHSSTPGPPR